MNIQIATNMSLRGAKLRGNPLVRRFKNNLLRLGILLTVGLMLGGCTSHMKTWQMTEKGYADNKSKIAEHKEIQNKQLPPVAKTSSYYVNIKPVPLKKPPAWLNQRITLNAYNTPFQLLANRILGDRGVIIEYGRAVNTDKRVTMNYSGSVKGALNVLAAKTGYAYNVTPKTVEWSDFITRTFNISFMPGSSAYLVGETEAGKREQVRGTDVESVMGSVYDDQYSNMRGANLSVWRDIEKTLNELKSPDGKVMVSESTTSVMVHDHPDRVRMMAQYINRLNKMMSQQVRIKVQVLEVELNKDFNYGINWDVVIRTLSGYRGSIAASPADAVDLSRTATGAISSGVLSLGIAKDGSGAILKALGEQGKVSIVTQPELTTLNNQIATLRVTRDTTYLKSVSNTVVSGSLTNENVTSALTPGTVTDGFVLYLLPKIQHNNIYLQISSTLSTLQSLDKVTNKPAGEDNQQNTQAIQVPALAEKQFNQRTLLHSGQTLVITGFKRINNINRRASFLGIKPLGGKGAKAENIETIVLITPIILRSQAS